MKLGVNIDHIATLREARKINEPDPLEAIFVLKNAGANQVTAHLREDRRHINDRDIKMIIESSMLNVNIESSINEEIINYLIKLKPHTITLVPENRQEVTTEGGLDLKNKKLKTIIKRCKDNDIKISLFIDPFIDNVNQAKELDADAIELHTGLFANLFLILNTNLNQTPNKIFFNNPRKKYYDVLEQLKLTARAAKKINLEVIAGHGLNYQNVEKIIDIQEIQELNIGHSIISRAIFCGLYQSIRDMINLIQKYRNEKSSN